MEETREPVDIDESAATNAAGDRQPTSDLTARFIEALVYEPSFLRRFGLAAAYRSWRSTGVLSRTATEALEAVTDDK